MFEYKMSYQVRPLQRLRDVPVRPGGVVVAEEAVANDVAAMDSTELKKSNEIEINQSFTLEVFNIQRSFTFLMFLN